jgi:hypothetical protein
MRYWWLFPIAVICYVISMAGVIIGNPWIAFTALTLQLVCTGALVVYANWDL